ncbi:hypothetical protein ACOA15_001247 [Klebsiella oxytoca]|uniref:hypothetical protein n=1 Tax=Klebsiella oxytoca TaxID=571 RepID=UPI001CCAA5AD|nr:hypothetical protein [Klebsiella oxytoca]MDM4530862.1 hypothetical protein [Klebsiella oxytoca]
MLQISCQEKELSVFAVECRRRRQKADGACTFPVPARWNVVQKIIKNPANLCRLTAKKIQ